MRSWMLMTLDEVNDYEPVDRDEEDEFLGWVEEQIEREEP